MRMSTVQDLIIDILSKLEGKSIRKNKLPAKIINQLQWDIRRTNRALFEKKVYKALVPLINQRIVKEFKYKKEYDDTCFRVKLLANYQRKLASCGGKMSIISFIEEPKTIDRIIRHLELTFEAEMRAFGIAFF